MSDDVKQPEEEELIDQETVTEDAATDDHDEQQEADDTEAEAVELPDLSPEEVAVLQADYNKAQEQLRELNDHVLRQRADFDNVRKRLRKEADESGKRALARFVGSLLVEMDNFDRAIESADPSAFQDFAAGVSMIKENIMNIFGQNNIELIPTEGVFDPKVHEVVHELEQADAERGSIIDVFRKGYRIGDNVVRAAQVVVAKPPAANAE